MKTNAGYIKRDIEAVLLKTKAMFPAVALTGPRQTGKTTLLKNLLGKEYKYLSFDDPSVSAVAVSDPKLLFSASQKYVLDEIQYAPKILSYVKLLIDENRSIKGRFIITGSQQFAMMKNLGDSLAGRIAVLDLLPFSLNEKNKSKAVTLKDPEDSFIDSCIAGSYPEIVIDRNIEARQWYSNYLRTYLERDIRTTYSIGDLNDFQRFIALLAARCSQILNMSNFSKELGVSVPTIKRWLSILEASGIIYLLQPYYSNFGKRIIKNPKIYFLDCGIVCHLTALTSKEQVMNGIMAGPLFENYIVSETVKKYYNKGSRPKLYYIRTSNNTEVDLLVEEGSKYKAYEIKLAKTANINLIKPMESIIKMFDETLVTEGNLVFLGESNTRLGKNISTLNYEEYIQGSERKD